MCWISGVTAQQVPGEPITNYDELDVLHVQGNIWLVAGAGANITIQAGAQGVIVVDSGAEGLTGLLLEAIAEITDLPIRYIINTSKAAQHVGGNSTLGSLPGGLPSGVGTGLLTNIIAHENVLFRMSSGNVFPVEAWPTDGYFAPRRGMIFNGEAIDIIHMPNAHSDGDSLVYFRGSNVLVTGDLYTNTSLPLINTSEGGTYMGLVEAFDQMIEITVADDLMEGGTFVIPGHGYIADEADLAEYRDMVFIIRDRLHRLIVEDGFTLEQVKEARPTLGWESRYSNPEWSTEMFIESIYQEFQAIRNGM